MQPLIVSQQITQGVADFLRAAFPATTPGFDGLIQRFLADRDRVFKGPYLTLPLPFRKQADRGQPTFGWLPPGFIPHAHQGRAFARLTGEQARSTLVATGTGSGKTECFLYPILEHCREQRELGRSGIKAIILYPMNALASDQASRLAKEILRTPALAGIRAGLYVGEAPAEESSRVQQLADGGFSIITDRNALREKLDRFLAEHSNHAFPIAVNAPTLVTELYTCLLSFTPPPVDQVQHLCGQLAKFITWMKQGGFPIKTAGALATQAYQQRRGDWLFAILEAVPKANLALYNHTPFRKGVLHSTQDQENWNKAMDLLLTTGMAQLEQKQGDEWNAWVKLHHEDVALVWQNGDRKWVASKEQWQTLSRVKDYVGLDDEKIAKAGIEDFWTFQKRAQLERIAKVDLTRPAPSTPKI